MSGESVEENNEMAEDESWQEAMDYLRARYLADYMVLYNSPSALAIELTGDMRKVVRVLADFEERATKAEARLDKLEDIIRHLVTFSIP